MEAKYAVAYLLGFKHVIERYNKNYKCTSAINKECLKFTEGEVNIGE